MRTLSVTIVSLLAACGDSSGSDPAPSNDAAGASDGSPAPSDAPVRGLVVEWSSQPLIPGLVRPGVIVSMAAFQARRIEVIGDAGASQNTMHVDRELTWGPSQPFPEEFELAPPGIYSKVTIDIDAVVGTSYTIAGMADVGGTMVPFRISDTESVIADVEPYTVTLPIGETATLHVRLDLSAALDLDYSTLRIVNGVRTLDQGDTAAIAAFRADLAMAFEPD